MIYCDRKPQKLFLEHLDLSINKGHQAFGIACVLLSHIFALIMSDAAPQVLGGRGESCQYCLFQFHVNVGIIIREVFILCAKPDIVQNLPQGCYPTHYTTWLFVSFVIVIWFIIFYAFYYHKELWQVSLLFYTRYTELLVYMPKEFQIKNQNNSQKYILKCTCTNIKCLPCLGRCQ